MRILGVSLENFASYKALDFAFNDQGLILIHGPNGAGKSTLCDAIPWVLFGRTAKNGSVDDILTWPGGLTAKGAITFELNGVQTSITRTRKPNDLYIDENTRGKDIPDTQRIINRLLGIDVEYFLSAAYFHEFSQIASFFTATPKVRRAICDQLVDLTLAKHLQTEITGEKKALSAQPLETEVQALSQQVSFLQNHIKSAQQRADQWETDRETMRLQLAEKHVSFEANRYSTLEKLRWQEKLWAKQQKEKVQELSARLAAPGICSECGAKRTPAPEAISRMQADVVKAKNAQNPYAQQITREEGLENTYLAQLDALDAQTNPHQPEALTKSFLEAQKDLALKQAALATLRTCLIDLTLLGDIIEAYRSTTIQSTIEGVERQTNEYLETHYDAELRVEFTVADGDKVDVVIQKDGNTCSYQQLSKGQRRILNFCLGVSVMRTLAQINGNTPSVIAFDEAFDGMDDNMKSKSFGLLTRLESDYGTILVVDHSSSFKALFPTQYRVELKDGSSELYEEA